MKRTIYLILISVFWLYSALVPADRAQKVAENYYAQYAPDAAKGNTIEKVLTKEYLGQPTWYVFQFTEGWVIVSADDAVRPILGYSFDGEITEDLDNMQNPFVNRFSYYDRQIVNIAREKGYVDTKAASNWKYIENNIFPKASKSVIIDALVESKWEQTRPWNNLCPEKDGTWTYVGPVATAAAMIMKYHQWPVSGTGSFTNTSTGTTETYSDYTFDYAAMKDVVEIEWGLYPEYWETINMSPEAVLNMAELNYLVGHSFNMYYGTEADGGSGANMGFSASALETHWDYTTVMSYMGTITDPSDYSSVIQAELNAKRPWWWAGAEHSFVLDGYTDDYWYHFNWGWGGYCDGWFQLSCLVPEGGAYSGKDGDYTSSQIRISCVPNNDPFDSYPPPENLTGQILNYDSVQLTWTKPAGYDPVTYKIYRSELSMWYCDDKEFIAETGSMTYSDAGLTENKYVYSVKAVYSDNESHFSGSFQADIVNIPQFPKISSLTADAVGRTNIDLHWTIPFTGLINYDQDFEYSGGAFPAGWQQWLYLGSGLNYWLPDDSNGDYIKITDKYTAPHIVLRPGDYALIVSTGHTYPAFFTTPEFTLASDTFVRFWTRFKGNPDTEQYPRFSVVTKTGAWSGRTVNVTRHETFDGDPADPDYHAWNDYEYEMEVPITGFGGVAAYVGFEVWVSNNYYTMSFDDILIGQYSGGIADDPTGFDIYRNGALAHTTADGVTDNWSDTGFADGNNEYFIKALYPTGTSISSEKITVLMDANPRPDYLTADTSSGDHVELNWYMPYGTPPHWSGYIEPQNCTTTVDYLHEQAVYKRRVRFRAEELGLYYPVTIDSLCAGFYEWPDDPWGANNTFILRLWDGDPDTGTLLYQTGTLTATPNEIFKYGLPMPVVVSNEWNVEVETFDQVTGFPSSLAGTSTDYVNSYFYYDAVSSYNYYILSEDKQPLSYCILSYCTSSDPDPIAKSGWTGNTDTVKEFGIEDKKERKITGIKTDGKALDHYIIYRDSVAIGTSTTTSYSDLVIPPSALKLDQKYIAQYYVTA